MMGEKVLCPYCGAEMVFWDFYTAFMIGGAFKCEKCSSYSPYGQLSYTVEEAKKNAIYAALRRYQPENRVLTFDDASTIENDQIVYCEGADGTWRFADGRHVKALISCNMFFTEENYGRDWRVWLRRPTEEERKAVKWDE